MIKYIRCIYITAAFAYITPMINAQSLMFIGANDSLAIKLPDGVGLESNVVSENLVYELILDKERLAVFQLGCYPSEFEERLEISSEKIGPFAGIWERENIMNRYSGTIILKLQDMSKYYDFLCINYDRISFSNLKSLFKIIFTIRQP